jgi:hypothetical protein
MKEKNFIIILRVSSIILITAFIAVILPYDIMNQIHQLIGLGKLPQSPILDYLARTVSFFYGIHGVLLLYISFNLIKYLKILKLLIILGFIFGITLFFIDLNAPLPLQWTLVEGPTVITLNIVFYLFIKSIEKEK